MRSSYRLFERITTATWRRNAPIDKRRGAPQQNPASPNEKIRLLEATSQ